MNDRNTIDFDKDRSKHLAEKLNALLANYFIFYQNWRGYHWNIQCEKFFKLHLKFEELFNGLELKSDEIAERILTLSHAPKHSYSDYKLISKF